MIRAFVAALALCLVCASGASATDGILILAHGNHGGARGRARATRRTQSVERKRRRCGEGARPQISDRGRVRDGGAADDPGGHRPARNTALALLKL